MSDTILSFCKRKSKIFCYGAGEYGRIAKLYLQSKGILIDGFVVTKLKDSSVSSVLSVPIFGLIDFPYDFSECAFIITMRPSYQDEVELELKSRGAINTYKPATDEISIMKKDIDLSNIKIDRSGVMVLLYHRIIDLDHDLWKISTSPALFEEEIAYLKANYNILKVGDDWSNAADNSVVITFDDGYMDNYKNALPILQKYSVPATFYICTGNIGTSREFWWDELENIIFKSTLRKIHWEGLGDIPISTEVEKMDACYRLHTVFKKANGEQRRKFLYKLAEISKVALAERPDYRSINQCELQEMAASQYVNIGAHTVSHSCMAFQSYEDLEYEIIQSKQTVEAIIGRPIKDFSYPFGGIADMGGDNSQKLLTDVGYQTIATTAAGVTKVENIQKKQIMRNTISADIKSIEDFIQFLDLTYAMSDGNCV